MPKTTKEYLAEMRALIADYDNWCYGHHAENREGLRVPVLSEDACRFCVDGAAIRVCGSPNTQGYNDVITALDAVTAEKYKVFCVMLNDMEGEALFHLARSASDEDVHKAAHAAVLECIDLAMQQVEA